MRVLVTGAARGLGFEIVREAMKRNHSIASLVRPESDNSNISALGEEYPERIAVFSADVTCVKQVESVVSELEDSWGALDGLINCAAVMEGRYERIDELNLDSVRKNFEVNLMGTVITVKQCLRLLYKGVNAVVINVSSEAGTIVNAYPANYGYAISKTAVNMFTERLRSHLVDKNISAWAVHPGWMRTAMGGGTAPVDPAVTAWGFWEIMERKTIITSKICFIDATGRPMPL